MKPLTLSECRPLATNECKDCVTCGAPAILSHEGNVYCKGCMQIHLVEKMFVNLTALQGKRHE